MDDKNLNSLYFRLKFKFIKSLVDQVTVTWGTGGNEQP